jgi:DNA-binding transcriptional MerR regulator
MSPGKRLRIGEVAELTGTTPRTIRYYEELGLLRRRSREPGSHRLYDESDVAQLRELLELRELLGVSLDELREIAAAETARASLRREWHEGIDDPVRRREVLTEAASYLDRQLELIRRRRDAIARLERELVAKRRRVRDRLRDVERDLPGGLVSGPRCSGREPATRSSGGLDRDWEPAAHGGANRVEVGLQAVVARDPDDGAARPRWRHPEAVALALDDEHRDLDRVQLVDPARPWLLALAGRRLERERQTEDGDGIRVLRRPTGNPSAQRAPAGDQRQATELLRAERLDHRCPGGVKARRRGGGALAGDAIRLLDERDGDPVLERRLGGGGQVTRLHSAAGAVAEHERAARSLREAQVRPRKAGGRLDLDDVHPRDASCWVVGWIRDRSLHLLK